MEVPFRPLRGRLNPRESRPVRAEDFYFMRKRKQRQRIARATGQAEQPCELIKEGTITYKQSRMKAKYGKRLK